MKKILVLICLILIAVSCKKEHLACEKFKTGKFMQNIEEQNLIVYSTRTKEGFQRDSSRLGISKYKLSWKSDCKLESTLVESTIETSKKHIGRKYNVVVIEVISDVQYIYKCQVDGYDFIDQDTIIKIN